MGSREANPKYPNEDGVWFQILDKDGKRMSLNPDSSSNVDCDYDTMLGWLPINNLGFAGSPPYNTPVLLLQGIIIDGSTSRLDAQDFESYDGSALSADIVDVNLLGVSRSDPFTIKEKDVPQNILEGRRGIWFQILDRDGNNIDLTNNTGKIKLPTSKRLTGIAWLGMKKRHPARVLRRIIIGRRLIGLKPREYDLYSSGTADTPFNDTDLVDPYIDGTNKYNPLTFKVTTDSSETGNYEDYTKQVRCTSKANWSGYADVGAIQNTYLGEILWTNGKLVKGIPNMYSYQVVRKDPSTGAVLNYGLAGNLPHYFVLVEN